jgi:uncharacterized membrane protein YfcA
MSIGTATPKAYRMGRQRETSRVEIHDYFFLVFLGLFAGGAGGLLGIGGSLVMIPGLVVLMGGDKQHLYQATAMIVNFFVVAPAVIRHWQAKATTRSLIRLMIPSAVIGAVLGVFVSELSVFQGSGQGYLQIGFAVFLGYVILYNIQRLRGRGRRSGPDEGDIRLSWPFVIGAVGLPTGLAGGLLGIGGGLFAVPAQQVCLRVPLRNAIANSATTILWSSILGAVLKNWSLSDHGFHVTQSLTLAACLIPSAIIGSWYTSARVHRWPVGVIRAVFVLLLLYFGVRMFLTGWGNITQ